jgi:hypothetical protein
MEVNNQFQASAPLPLAKEPAVPIGYEALDAVETGKISYLCPESNLGRPARNPSLYRLSYPGSGIQSLEFQIVPD